MTDAEQFIPEPDDGYTVPEKGNPDQRPTPIPMNPDGISSELVSYPHWVCWRFEWKSGRGDDGEWSKIPINPATGKNARANDPNATAGSFEDALDYHERDDTDTDGLGFVLTDSPFSGVDLDGLYDPETGEWDETGREIIDTLGSYSEFSPGARGGHVIMIGELPEGGRKNDPIEMYDSGRYFTVTGQRIPDTPDSIPNRETGEERLADVHRNIFPDDTNEKLATPSADGGVATSENTTANSLGDQNPNLSLSDDEVIERAKNAKNGDKFRRLWNGSSTGYASHSEADSALCWLLAFWTGPDEDQIDRLFRQSGLYREKWDETHYSNGDTYGEGTIKNALQERNGEYYAHGVTPDNGTVTSASNGPTTLPGGERTLNEQIKDVLLAYESDDDMSQRAVIHRAANAIMDEYHFVHPPMDADAWRSVLYRYDESEGVYVPDGKRFVAELGEQLLGEFLTNSQTTELVGKIKRRSGVDAVELETPPNRLVVGNGILDLKTGELDPWTPDEYHRTKNHREYHPDAECPRIDEFFRSIVKPKDVPTLYQLAAHSLYKEYVGEKAAMLVGDGENGKSVFLDVLEHFLGGSNVSHRSLQDLDGQQFAANNLEGKLANFHPDMEDEKVKNLGLFKQLTGRDTLTGDVKFEKPIDFENYATMIFSANRIPAMDEDTHALWRRWIYLKFPNTFEKGSEDYKEKAELMREVTTEGELEGLLARCVEEIKEWDDGREWFTNIDSPEQVREKMKRASEPVYNFVTVCLERDENNSIPKDMVRKCYRQYAREEDLPTIPANQFGKKVVNIRDFPIETGQPRIDGRQVHAYTGVRFTSRGRQVIGLDEAEDSAQTAVDDGGPQGRRDTVIEAVKNLGGTSEPVQKGIVIGYVVGNGLTMDQADRAWSQLVERGTIWSPADADGYLMT